MRALEVAEAKRTTIDVDTLVDGMLDLHRRGTEAAPASAGAAVDLVVLGLAAVAALLGR